MAPRIGRFSAAGIGQPMAYAEDSGELESKNQNGLHIGMHLYCEMIGAVEVKIFICCSVKSVR